jgi:hypothetical protein
MLCSACIIELPQMGDRIRQEMVKAGEMVKTVSKRIIRWMFTSTIGVALVAGIWIAFVAGVAYGLIVLLVGICFAFAVALWLYNRKEYSVPLYRSVTESVEVGRSKCCIACRKPVEHL